MLKKHKIVIYVQWTVSIILLLTEGGTPLEAMQRYGPMWSRLTRDMLNVAPSTLVAGNKLSMKQRSRKLTNSVYCILKCSVVLLRYDIKLIWFMTDFHDKAKTTYNNIFINYCKTESHTEGNRRVPWGLRLPALNLKPINMHGHPSPLSLRFLYCLTINFILCTYFKCLDNIYSKKLKITLPINILCIM